MKFKDRLKKRNRIKTMKCKVCEKPLIGRPLPNRTDNMIMCNSCYIAMVTKIREKHAA
jgi:hypothetical protein